MIGSILFVNIVQNQEGKKIDIRVNKSSIKWAEIFTSLKNFPGQIGKSPERWKI